MNTRIILTSIISVFLFITLSAQQNNTLKGKVLYLNSKKKPAVGVEVSGKIKQMENANIVYTSDNGGYKLVFPTERDGHLVELKIGKNDANNQPLELVNEKEVEICRIPADATHEFEVIVCPKGARDVAAQKYYKIIKTSSNRALAKMKKEVDNLLEQKEKNYQKIGEMSELIIKLEQQADSAAIYKEALKIASINKDNASDRVLKYIDCIDNGDNIQNCIHILNKDKATKQGKESINNFKAAIDELNTQANSYSIIFEYKDAIACYDSILLILEANRDYINPLKRIEYHFKISEVLYDDGDFKSAFKHQQRCIEIQESMIPVDSIELSSYYSKIGYIYQALGQYEKALTYQLKDIKIKEIFLDSLDIELSKSYNNISMTYYFLSNFEEGLDFIQKSLNIKNKILKEDNYSLAQSYRNLGSIYLGLGDFKKAIEFQKKDIELSERVLKLNHPDLATANSNIGVTYEQIGEYNEALRFQKKALKIRKSILNNKHPDLAISNNNVATVYRFLGKIDTALTFHLKAIELFEPAYPEHPNLAIFYGNAGVDYYYLGEHENALKFCLKDISIKEKNFGENHPSIDNSYLFIAIIYQALNQNDKALKYQFKDIIVKEKAYGKNHPNLGYSYGNLGYIYLKMENFSQALAYTEKGIEICQQSFPESHPMLKQQFTNKMEIYLTRSQKAIDEKNFDFALNDLDSITMFADTSYGNLFKTYYNIGICHLNLLNHIEAIKNFQMAAILAPELKKGGYFNNIGLAYAKSFQFDEAKLAFLEYEKIFPDKIETHCNWFIFYVLQKQNMQAFSHLQKALDLGFDDVDWLKTEKGLKDIRREKKFKQMLKDLEKKAEK